MKILYCLLFAVTIGYSQKFNTAVSLTNEKDNPTKPIIEKNLSAMLTEMTRAFGNGEPVQFIQGAVTDQGEEAIVQLWEARPFRPNVADTIYLDLIRRTDGMYEVRGIPLLQFDDNGKGLNQEGVFVVNGRGEIDDLKFGIEEQQYKAVMRYGLDVKESRRRLLIVNFVENFRTAYNKKDISYVEKVFSDKALIIVGRVLEEQDAVISLQNNMEKNRYELVRYSKQQYIKNLRSTFRNNQYIRVTFDSIQITQHPMHESIYAVNLIQGWNSSTYSDRGYLFLMVDFKNETKPIIHVRAWEPTDSVSGKNRIALGDFIILE